MPERTLCLTTPNQLHSGTRHDEGDGVRVRGPWRPSHGSEGGVGRGQYGSASAAPRRHGRASTTNGAPAMSPVNGGERIRQLRLDVGLSIRRLATQTGFSPSLISQVEHGLVMPSIGSLERIAMALG